MWSYTTHGSYTKKDKSLSQEHTAREWKLSGGFKSATLFQNVLQSILIALPYRKVLKGNKSLFNVLEPS
jgi:hypothetical protein